MKNVYKNSLLALFTAFLVVSCELETNPTTAVDAAEVFKTTQDADKVLIGSWSYLMETFNSYANPGYGAMLRANDAMGSDVVLNTRYGFSTHYAFSALYAKGGTNSLSWVLAYKTINNMNAVIKNIDQAQGSETEKNRIKGQAFGLRGFMYLHLASSYAFAIDKDPQAIAVPIYTEPSDENTIGRPAATVSQVYTQSIADLEQALVLIPENYQRNSKYKIDTQVVLGLLSRATLYARDWQKAKTYSDRLLAKDHYLMNESEYKAGFNDIQNREWIWGHPQTTAQSDASYQFHFLDTTTEESYYYSFNADPYFRTLFDDSDYRKKIINWATDPGKDPQKEAFVWMRVAKFKFKTGAIADIVLMRTAEMYLINAEAKARLNEGDALDVLNQLKTARGAVNAQGLSGQALLEAIWLERRKELFGEGFSLTDIVRNQQTVVRKEYPQSPKIDYSYTDAAGNSQTVALTPQGHRVFVFPDQTAFVPNSKYYLYRIPNSEELENSDLYSEMAKK
ncbi:RagB/SusD family nutrient uptake outer membrane protein [Flavobacterium sp. JP2137]|uniref:RagB/SusD family nutrient uptake outer membrane protein n=1 Tax=Flavobacterium sp. JP2137 TaxID=3414510 RepID=UPI003D2F9FD6